MSVPELYGALKKTVSLLLVDDDPGQLDYYEEMLSGHPLYVVHRAATAREAEYFIRSGKPLHLCILDLGIDDIEDDEFYLLKRYSKKIPVIIVSGSADIERAFIASRFGAAGMLAKPPDMASPAFWDRLRDLFLKKTVLLDISGLVNPILEECCRILREDLPGNVSDWAGKANITDTYLRRLWTECFACSPKHVLFMYKLYKNAFDWFDDRYLAELNDRRPRLDTTDFPGHQQQIGYYLLHRRVLDGIRDKNQGAETRVVPTAVLMDA